MINISLSFLLIFIVQGATTLYMRVSARLDEFARHGENVLQVTSLLLEKQVEQREEGLRAIVGGADMNDAGRDVLVAAVLDGNTVERGIKGWLPDGMLLPDELLTDEWVVNDLLDIYGRSLLTGVRTIQGKRVFAAIRLNMNELDVFGDHLLLPVISDNLGQIVWMGATKEAPALSEHLKARGFILRKKIPDQRWAIALSHQGSRVMMRQEQLPYGFTFTIAYPLASLMISSLSGLAVAAMLFLFALLVILLLWALWNRGVYKSIATIANLADEMGDRLSQIDARDPLRGAETLFTLTKRFSGFKETFVRETNSFVRDLRNLFEVILRQQEELTAFNEETEAMNQTLAVTALGDVLVRQVDHGKRADAHDAQVRVQCRERVVGHPLGERRPPRAQALRISDGGQAGAQPEPAGDVGADLRPREHPRDGPQVRKVAALRSAAAPGRP